MRPIKMISSAAAIVLAGFVLSGCGDPSAAEGDQDEAAAASESGGDASAETSSSDDSATAADQEQASAYVGHWVEEGAQNAAEITVLADGSVTTNEPSLPRGDWEEGADGGLVLNFGNTSQMRITGRMDGDILILTTMGGDTGRFARQGAGGGSASSSRGGGGSSSGGGDAGGGKPD